MKSKKKETVSRRPPKPEAQASATFIVPSHGRLARRGSTGIVADGGDGRRVPRDPPDDAS
jgi:hypothetical protein